MRKGGMEKDGVGRDRERRDGEGWRGHGVLWSEGGRGSRAHSPELVVARVLVIAYVLIVTRVLTVTRLLIIAHVRSCALAVICETRWPSWLVVGRMRCGSWAMKGLVAACGQWMWVIVHGQWAAVVVGGGW